MNDGIKNHTEHKAPLSCPGYIKDPEALVCNSKHRAPDGLVSH